MSASITKSNRAAIKAEKMARFAEFRRAVSAMSEDERADLARRMPIVNVTGHSLSVFNNCLLIKQSSGAPLTIVGGFKQWLAAGRCVAAGQHGYAIWYPRGKRKAADGPEAADDEKRSAVSFGTATVFDISQTVALGPVSADIESAPLSICYGDTVIAKRPS